MQSIRKQTAAAKVRNCIIVCREQHRRTGPALVWYSVSGFCYNENAITCRNEVRTTVVHMTPVAVAKVKEIMDQQNPRPAALRVAVVGGGCSGFQYHMAFDNNQNSTDNVVEVDGLKVLVDQMSLMYLNGVEIDYIETLEGAGFKFNNPNVKSTCGCGSSFSV